MIGPVRNSIIPLGKNILIFVIASLIGLMIVNDNLIGRLVLVIVDIVVIFILYRVWSKTTYTFDDTQMISEKDTVFKKRTTVPYTKIASINVIRTVTDRIFGNSTLYFNVNSNVNTNIPEVSLVIERHLADDIYDLVRSKISGPETLVSDDAEEPAYEPIASFKWFDVVIHSFFSTSTLSLIIGALFFVYSVYGLFNDDAPAGGVLFSVMMFIAQLLIPVISKIIRYHDFRVYRIGDRICLDHGLLRKYHSEFDVSRINAVKIQRPLFVRILGRSYLQAEVVGMNAVENEVSPTVCLISSDKEIDMVMHTLLPEFIYDGEVLKQPSEAKVPIYIGSIVGLIITLVISVNLILMINGIYDPSLKVKESMMLLLDCITIILSAVSVSYFLFRGPVSIRSKEYVMGDEFFTFTNGVIDRVTATVQYDRVQIVKMKSGFVARRYSLAVCSVSLLSAIGGSEVTSGYFRTDDLDRIQSTILRRLSDGSYDYTKNMI